MRSLLVLALVAPLAGCSTPWPLHKLPTFDDAVAMPGPDRPKLLDAGQTDLTRLPQIIPFAVYEASSDISRTGLARAVWHKAATFRPDVVIVSDLPDAYAGSTGTAVAVPFAGSGIATVFSTPHYVRRMLAVCYRLAPVRLGVHANEVGMVTAIAEDSPCREAGLQEGDTVLSIDGAPVSYGESWMRLGHHSVMLHRKPGDEVRLVWIRPGTGRVEGVCKYAENPSDYLDQLPDAVEWENPARRKDGDAGY